MQYQSFLQNPWCILVQPVEQMDKSQPGDFSIQTWCIPLEAFFSNKGIQSN